MNSGRTKKSIINIMAGTGYQIFSIVMNFISRTIFIHTLGSGYLGLNSLFYNILTVLSLAELGIGTAMIYCMYEPLAKKNKEKLAALTQYFKVLYRKIACIVFVLGIAVIPFLKYIVNLQNDISHLTLYYTLFLMDTVVSYLCMYKTSVLTADQKSYILQIFKMLFDTLRLVVQIIILIVAKNYLLYLIVQIFCSVFYNLISAFYVGKKYPYINNKAEKISEIEKESIWSNIKSMFSYKVGGVILNNTDQLLISILVSTEYVGLYSNYYLPIKSVMGVTSAVFIAVQASIGNLAVEKDSKRQYEIFNLLDMVSFWLYGIFTVGFCIMLQDFISLWIGDSYLLSNYLVYIISITYYLTGVLYPIWCYRETVGLFQYTKNIMFYASAINLILSVIFGKLWGMEGILLATIVARILTNIWFEPYKLFSIYFNKSVYKYYKEKIQQSIILVLLVIVIQRISYFINIKNLFIHFIVKGIMCVVITNIVIYIYLRNKPEAKDLFNIIRCLLKRFC